jgi:multidrug resistance efflux pump
MRRLKFRRIADSLPNEPRRRRQAVIRWIYIACVVGLAAVLGDVFAGSLFYLRSEGLVVGDAAVIAAEFPVTIRDIRVHQGDRVHAGDIAAIVSSQSVTEAIARLTGELASREVRLSELRLSELRIRGETVDAIIGFAETRHFIAANARKELETLMERGLLSIDKRTAAVETEYRSEQDLSSLKAERRVIEGEMGSLAGVLGEARSAIGELRRLYDQGQMRVPIDGIVGRVAAEQGAVVRAGEPLFEIYGEQRYVLGYLPTGGLHEIKPGDRVTIETGLQTAEGIVARVEPIATALPREFQGVFTPVERQQVIRIEFAEGETPLPLFTKVKLRSGILLPHWIRWIW